MVDWNVKPHDFLWRKRCLFQRLESHSYFRCYWEGLDGLQNSDPFHGINPLATSDALEEVDGNESETERDMYISPFVDHNEESEYKDEDGKIFDIFNEESDDE